VANDDTVITNEDVFDDQAHDALALDDVKRARGTAQSGEKRGESLGQPQKRSPIGGLVSDCLQLGV